MIEYNKNAIKLTRRYHLGFASIRLLVAVASVITSLGADVQQHPNVMVIMTDDQGWGDLSLHGNQSVETPNIDRLARQGLQFDRFDVAPVCSPTRAEFLSGR